MHMRTRFVVVLATLALGLACDGAALPPDAAFALDAGAPATADVFEREPNDRPPWAEPCTSEPCPSGQPTLFTPGEAIGGVISPPETTLPDRDLFITHLGLGELLEIRVAGVDASLELGVTVRAVHPDPRYDPRPLRTLGNDGLVQAPAYFEDDYVVIVEDARVARGEEGFWGGWYVLETRALPPVALDRRR